MNDTEMQLIKTETACAIFKDNIQLCNEVTEQLVQEFVHSIETNGHHTEYIKFLQTIVKANGTYIRKCQDTVMSEVRHNATSHHANNMTALYNTRVRTCHGKPGKSWNL